MGEATDQVGVKGAPRAAHIVWCVRAESLPKLQKFWENALGVPLAKFDVEALNISVLMSWDAGVEIVAPMAGVAEPSTFDAFLDEKGEGVYSAVYDVDDLDAAVKQAVANGATVAFEVTDDPDELAERLGWGPERRVLVRQAILNDYMGTTICLQECTPLTEGSDAHLDSALRLHHGLWCVRGESLPLLRRYWEDALGAPMRLCDVEDLGISVLISWDAGVEVFAPILAVDGALTDAVNAFLEARGDSVWGVVYDVDDLDKAIKQAVAGGAKVIFEELIEPETLAPRVGWGPEHPRIQVRQALLEEYCGTSVCLQEQREV